MKCSSCQRENAPDASFCSQCGAKLTGGAGAVSAPPSGGTTRSKLTSYSTCLIKKPAPAIETIRMTGGNEMTATKHTYVRTHAISGNALTFDLKRTHADLIKRARAAKAGRTATTLVKEGALRITVVALKQGVSLQEHQVAGAVSIQALRGSIAVEADGARSDLRAGQLLVLGADIRHKATAVTDCAILITMALG